MYVKKSHSDRHSITAWFIETLNEEAEEYVRGGLSEMLLQRNVLCQDGKLRDLWACGSYFVSEMRKLKENLNLDFKEFHRQGSKGEIREV